MSPATNKHLLRTYFCKRDEIYTTTETANAFINSIADNIRDKIIYMPCDNTQSAIWRAFVDRFNELELRALVATSLERVKHEYDGKTLIRTDIPCGDILHEDNLRLARQSDTIVATNPPFGLIRKIIRVYLQQNIKFALIWIYNSMPSFKLLPHLGWDLLDAPFYAFCSPDNKPYNAGRPIVITNLWRYGKSYKPRAGKIKRKFILPADKLEDTQYRNIDVQICGSYHDIDYATSEYIAAPVTSLFHDVGLGTKYDLVDIVTPFHKGKEFFARVLLRRLDGGDC